MREQHPGLVRSIREIGGQINEIGGLNAMCDASARVYRITGERFSTGADFNQLWDGVGDWRA